MSVREKILNGVQAAGSLTWEGTVALLDYPERGQLMTGIRQLEAEGLIKRVVAFQNGALSHTVQYTG